MAKSMSITIHDNSSRYSIMKSADLGLTIREERTNQNENLLAIENDPQPAVPALALALATVTASSAVASSTHVKRGHQIHFEAVVPQHTQQAGGWYKPARSPAFDPYLYGG